MELNELHVLEGQASSASHGHTVAGAGVSAGTGLVTASDATGRQNLCHHSNLSLTRSTFLALYRGFVYTV